jgi:hypothetical protein
MGGHKTISGSSYPVPIPPVPPPVPDYVATGNPSPDCKGNYFLAGIYNGQPYYNRADGLFLIWREPLLNTWYITKILGEELPYCWTHIDISILGIYVPLPPATGTATVSLGA